MKENPLKFKELVLYVCSKCATHPKFGATKLNKVLFFSDLIAYRKLGKAITGMEYQKLPNGPAPRKLLPVQQEMISGGDLVIQPRTLWTGKVQHRPVNLRSATLSLFSAEEIAIVDAVIDALRDLTADQASSLSHEDIGWKAARLGETIPYETALLSAKEPTSLDLRRAAHVAEEYADLLASIA